MGLEADVKHFHSVEVGLFFLSLSFFQSALRTAFLRRKVSSISFNILKKIHLTFWENPACADLDWNIFSSEEIKKNVSYLPRCEFPMGHRQGGWESSWEVMNEFHCALTPLPSIAVSVIYQQSSYFKFLTLWEVFQSEKQLCCQFLRAQETFSTRGCWSTFLALFMSCCSLTAVSSHMCGAYVRSL